MVEIPDIALWYFYKEIILFYENAKYSDLMGFRRFDPELVAFLLISKITFPSLRPQDVILPPDSYKSKAVSFIFVKPTSKEEHTLSILASFLKHLRNSFSHGHYSMISLEGVYYLCLEDFPNRKKKAYSMITQIPYAHFFLLVDLIKKNQKK